MSKFVNKLSDHGYPTSSRHYKAAHQEADRKEKAKFPKGYEELKKAERHLGKHELMAKNTKSGKVEIEKKFNKYSKELAYHERQEHKNLRRMEKK